MVGYFTNSKLGKSVTIPDITNEYMNYNQYNDFYKYYIIFFKQTAETDTPEKIQAIFDFPIEKIEIKATVINDKGEAEEKTIRTITNMHQIKDISSSVDTESFEVYNKIGFRE